GGHLVQHEPQRRLHLHGGGAWRGDLHLLDDAERGARGLDVDLERDVDLDLQLVRRGRRRRWRLADRRLDEHLLGRRRLRPLGAPGSPAMTRCRTVRHGPVASRRRTGYELVFLCATWLIPRRTCATIRAPAPSPTVPGGRCHMPTPHALVQDPAETDEQLAEQTRY